MVKSLISFIKKIFLKLRLWNVDYSNLSHLIHIGKYTILETKFESTIQFNTNIVIHNFVKLVAEDNGKIIFGNRVNIGDYSTIRASRATVEIGSNTMLGQYVKLLSTNHAYKIKDKFIYEQDIDLNKIGIKIGNDCWLGAGCIVLPGVTIGDGVVVGAHAVVTKNIPDYAVVVGNPAKIISYRL
jgi:acetyltransferase-like isoleucine patch superfamily enzyme